MTRRSSSVPYVTWCCVVVLASPLIALGLLLRWIRGKGREGFCQRLVGARVPGADGAPRLWVHACSVGEVAAAAAIVEELRRRRQGIDVVLTVITPGGFEAGQRLPQFDHVCYAPFDLPFLVRGFVRRLAPDVFVDIETELWPIMLHQARQLGVPMLLLHGRISDRSIGGYRRMRAGTRWMLRHFDRIMAQSRRDADRLVELGAVPDRVSVAGNAKYDGAPAALGADEVLQLRRQFHLGPGPVWVVGSTRQPGEERLVLEAFATARRSVPDLLLVLAPRHVTRVPAVLTMARAAGIDAATIGERTAAPCRVVDTMGLLARLYSVGAVAFVGNSLVSPGGGQNLIEPLAQGVPVLVGPWTWEFRDASDLALQAGVAWQVRDAAELAAHVARFAASPSEPEFRSRALALVNAQRGAAARYAMAIDEALAAGARVAA